MNEKMEKMLKALRLHALRERWDEYIKMAARSRTSLVALLDRLTETSYVINMHNCRGIRGSLEGES